MRFAGLEELEAGRADLEAVIRAWCEWKACQKMCDERARACDATG
jgi:exonuclease VII small subunit